MRRGRKETGKETEEEKKKHEEEQAKKEREEQEIQEQVEERHEEYKTHAMYPLLEKYAHDKEADKEGGAGNLFSTHKV